MASSPIDNHIPQELPSGMVAPLEYKTTPPSPAEPRGHRNLRNIRRPRHARDASTAHRVGELGRVARASCDVSVRHTYVQIRPPITNSASNHDHETVFLAMFMYRIQTKFLNITAFDENIRIVYLSTTLTSGRPRFNTIEAARTSPV